MLISILKANSLKVDSENTTFTLVKWWVESQDGWTKDQKQEAFNKIHTSDALRYHCMKPLFLASYATRIPWVEASGHGLSIIQQAVRESSRSPLSDNKPDLPKSRATGNKNYKMNIELGREQLVADDIDIFCFTGIIEGFPVLARVSKTKALGVETSTFGLFVAWYGGSGLPWTTRERRAPGLMITANVRLTPDPKGKGQINLFSNTTLEENYYLGIFGISRQPWDEVVCEGSPYFTNGIMKMEFTVTVRQ